MIKALLLDDRDVLRAVVDLADESELTERHVDFRPYGGECDRKPGEYRWDRAKNCLVPLRRAQRAATGRMTVEMAYAFDLLVRWKAAPRALPDATIEWLDDVVCSVDFKSLAQVPLVAEYRAARGINTQQGA